jgi:hypothetical protein
MQVDFDTYLWQLRREQRAGARRVGARGFRLPVEPLAVEPLGAEPLGRRPRVPSEELARRARPSSGRAAL